MNFKSNPNRIACIEIEYKQSNRIVVIRSRSKSNRDSDLPITENCKVKVKGDPTLWSVGGGGLISLSTTVIPWSEISTFVSDAWPVRRHTYAIRPTCPVDADTRCAYPGEDGQAELTPVAG